MPLRSLDRAWSSDLGTREFRGSEERADRNAERVPQRDQRADRRASPAHFQVLNEPRAQIGRIRERFLRKPGSVTSAAQVRANESQDFGDASGHSRSGYRGPLLRNHEVAVRGFGKVSRGSRSQGVRLPHARSLRSRRDSRSGLLGRRFRRVARCSSVGRRCRAPRGWRRWLRRGRRARRGRNRRQRRRGPRQRRLDQRRRREWPSCGRRLHGRPAGRRGRLCRAGLRERWRHLRGPAGRVRQRREVLAPVRRWRGMRRDAPVRVRRHGPGRLPRHSQERRILRESPVLRGGRRLRVQRRARGHRLLGHLRLSVRAGREREPLPKRFQQSVALPRPLCGTGFRVHRRDRRHGVLVLLLPEGELLNSSRAPRMGFLPPIRLPRNVG